MKTIIYLSGWVFFMLLLTGTGTYAFAGNTKQDTTKTDDDTYGRGGTKETMTRTDKDGAKVTIIIVKDGGKMVREQHVTAVEQDGTKRTSDDVRDALGRSIYFKTTTTDQLGTVTNFEETRSKEGKKVSGFRWHLDDSGKKHTESWDGNNWVEKNGGVSQNGTENIADRSSDNLLFGGFSVIREDGGPGFFTYGPEVQFSHFISNQIALSADLGLTFGNSISVDYTKKVIMVGAVAELLHNAEKNQSKLDVNVHAYGGVSSITSSFSFASTTYKYTSNVFTADVGVGAGLPLNSDGSIMLAANVDYIPTISSMVKSNVRASLGLNFWIRRHQGHH